MIVWKQFVLFILFLIVFVCVGQVQGGREEQDDPSPKLQLRRKTKRSKDRLQDSSRLQYSIYDQIADESDTSNGGTASYGMKLQRNNPPTLNLHTQAAQVPAIRNPRADANYLRQFHYSSRGVDPSVGNGGGGSGGGGYEHGGRQLSLSSFGLNNLQSAASSAPSEYVYGEGVGQDPHDNYVAAGGHHQSYGHGGGGGGHGHGHGKDCNSALGLLGVLGLASYLQNVLRQMSTTIAGRRKKRDATGNEPEDSWSPQDITPQMLPLLSQISLARDGRVPWKCALRPVCLINSIISTRFGPEGKPLTQQLKNTLESSTQSKWRVQRALGLATRAGELHKDCWKLYPHCPQMERLIALNPTFIPS